MPPKSASAQQIALLQSNSLTMLVQREIERLILAGEFPPGFKLTEIELALRLGVSRGPVREAFRVLEESGLVRLEKNRGVFVREVSVREADEIYEVRAALDELAERKLAGGITPAQLKDLNDLLDRMDKATAKRDVQAYYPLNLEFHDRLIAFTGNEKLIASYRRLVNELKLYRLSALIKGGGLPVSNDEHRRIVKRIAARDPEGAAAAIHAHVVASRARMHKAQDAPAANGAEVVPMNRGRRK